MNQEERIAQKYICRFLGDMRSDGEELNLYNPESCYTTENNF